MIFNVYLNHDLNHNNPDIYVRIRRLRFICLYWMCVIVYISLFRSYLNVCHTATLDDEDYNYAHG